MSASDPATRSWAGDPSRLRRFEDFSEWPMLLLSLAMIPLIVIPLATDVSDSTDQALETVFWILWAMFGLELGIRIYLAERRIRYVWSHWYDVLIVAVPFLRPLRVLRSARALRVLRLSRVFPALTHAGETSLDIAKRGGLHYVGIMVVGLIFAAAGVELALERGHGSIDNYGTALWWSISTISSVGYGDTVPQTPEGKGLAVFLMLTGIAFAAWITANVAAYLVKFQNDGHSPRDVHIKA